jgi:hypothetical protein
VSQADARRYAAVLARPGAAAAVPPGVDPVEFHLALLEDTYEVVAGLELVTAALALVPGARPGTEAVTWPGTPVLRIESGDDLAQVGAVLDGCAALGATEAAVLPGDVPDLPRLLLGKLYRALGSSEVAVCPAEGGGLVALAARLPVPGWLASAGTGLDTPDALARLRAAAPSRRALAVGPGWHRLRMAADLARLDPGLEGWDATRTLLAASAR